jgi:serine/alanine adding enzyme
MIHSIEAMQMENHSLWDSYVNGQEKANPYHLWKWQQVITEAYGHKTYTLAALGKPDSHGNDENNRDPISSKISGILPLVHLKDIFFGNRLVSMPYFDHGGILGDDPEAETKLIEAAIQLGRKLKVERIELRHLYNISSLPGEPVPYKKNGFCGKIPFVSGLSKNGRISQPGWSLRTSKVRMVMSLPDSSGVLMKSFKSKLRSQINRPVKAGLEAKIGGIELLDDFYRVFVTHMHDLGSPVHSKLFLHKVMEKFSDTAGIVLIHDGEKPFAASIIVGFKDVMINPWASALREYSRLSPNMLLYSTMLSYACDKGYRHFDFGRSTPEEGTYRFKSQWGAQPQRMYWYTFWLQDKIPQSDNESGTKNKKRELAASLWSRLPVSVSRIAGPIIRKYIDL